MNKLKQAREELAREREARLTDWLYNSQYEVYGGRKGKAVTVVVEQPPDGLPTGIAIDPSITLDAFVGQERAKQLVRLSLDVWRAKPDEVPKHMLFTGPGGTGKSTIAHAVANAMRTHFVTTTPDMLARPSQIFEFFFTPDYQCKLSKGDVVFIDECHGFSRRMAGYLYNVLQDFCLDHTVCEDSLVYGGREYLKGDAVRLAIPQFLCIGATTDAGLMHPPLRSRFVNRIEFDDYTEDDISRIVQGYKPVALGAAREIAARSAGNPRRAKALCQLAWLVCQRRGALEVGVDDVLEACALYALDNLGLDNNARRVVNFFIQNGNRPAGTAPISAATGIYKTTLDGEVFPSMSYAGILVLSQRGKCLTDRYFEKVRS